VTGEADPEALRRKLAPLESLAKAVGIVCIIYAIFDGSLAVYHGGWVTLARFGAISSPWPFHRSDAISAIWLASVVAVTGFTAGYGLRNLRRWSLWTVGALTLAILLQFAVQAYIDYRERGNSMSALTMLVLGAMLLIPLTALWGLDLRGVLSKDYGRVVADTPHVQVRAKLPLALKCTMALMLVVLIGLVWAQ
jgi:hypothetical protein